jgi:cellulose biosynthesis protein BcsQ
MIEKRGKILSFANPKGGVGKSTLSCLVTAMLKWSNTYNSVQLIDADKQGSSVRLLQRISNNIPCSHYPISYEYDKLNVLLLEQLMNNCRMQKGNILVIDTPARPDQEGIELLTKSHAIIIPCSNTLAELPITLEFVKKIDDLKARIKKIHPHIVIIPNKIHLNRKHIDDFIKYFDNHDVVIGPPIHDSAFIRKVYTKNYDYQKISQETIFSDLNNVVKFLKKYVIDEELDEIYRVDKHNRVEGVSNIR